MNKFNNLVEQLMEAPVMPGAGTDATDTDTTNTIDVVKGLYSIDPAKVKLIFMNDKLNDQQKYEQFINELKKVIEPDNLSKLERFFKNLGKEWKGASRLKKGEMALGGIAKVAKGLFVPTHSGSTGVFA